MSDPKIKKYSDTVHGKVFTKSDAATPGLKSGDVVALRVQGSFLAAVKAPLQHHDVPGKTLYTLMPCHEATIEDREVFLEVVRHGEWIGFRSWVANNALLQAKKRGVQRLVFYSTRFGIFEQWSSIDVTPLDSIHWKSTIMTFQNRKVCNCEMKVEVHRVGFVTGDLQHGTALPRMLEETESIKAISGMMVDEWIKFVEKEKERRSLLEAQVERAIENVDGLKQWASEQVQCARRDVQEHIELLIHALNTKNAELADANARLTTRIQWGAALLEAKKATVLGRRVLLAWKSRCSRSKYQDAVVLKLRKRNQIRWALSALDAWTARVEMSKELQRRLRLGVRRMSSLKMHCAFSKWRQVSYESHETAKIDASMRHDALLIFQSQMAKRVMNAWRRRTSRSNEAQRLLLFCESRQKGNLLTSAFESWKRHMIESRISLESFQNRMVLRDRIQLLSLTLHLWRVSVDDELGEKIELDRSAFMYAKKLKRKFFDAWNITILEARHSLHLAESMKSGHENATKTQYIKQWRDYTLHASEKRTQFVAFVLATAEKTTRMSITFWKEYTMYQKRSRVYISHAQSKRNTFALFDCMSWWRALTQEEKLHRKFVKICTQRRCARSMKCFFASWRRQCQKSTKSYMNLINYTDTWSKKRMIVAFNALREHASENALEQGMYKKAVNWHSGRLSARALWALEISVQRHHLFLERLQHIKHRRDMNLKKFVWNAWIYETDETVGREAICNNFQARKKWHTQNHFFVVWRSFVAETIFWDRSTISRKKHLDLKRIRWLFHTWRETVAGQISENALNRKAELWHSVKKSNRVINAWRQFNLEMQKTYHICDVIFSQKEAKVMQDVFRNWRSTWEYHDHLRLSGQKVMDCYATRLQISALKFWRNKAIQSETRAILTRRAISKLLLVKARNIFQNWHQYVEDESGKTIYCMHIQRHIVQKKNRNTLRDIFDGWRMRRQYIECRLSQFEDRKRHRLRVLTSIGFACWRSKAKTTALRQRQMLQIVRSNKALQLSRKSFVSWRNETTRSTRNCIVAIHAVERIALKLQKQAWYAWRTTTADKRQERNMMVSLLESHFHRRMRRVLTSWRMYAIEACRVRKNLERCVLQKKIGWDLFQRTYWDTVDDQLHETLGAMFHDPEDTCSLEVEKMTGTKVFTEHSFDYSNTTREETDSFSTDATLEEVSDALLARQKELSAMVCKALEQSSDSPGHALTPPKHDLNVLEPLHFFFSRRNFQDSISGATSLCASDFSASEIEESDNELTELLEIGDFSSISCSTIDTEATSRFAGTKKRNSPEKPLNVAYKSKQAAELCSPPGSPLILACEDIVC